MKYFSTLAYLWKKWPPLVFDNWQVVTSFLVKAVTQFLIFSGVTTFNSLSADFKSMLMPRSASGPHITVSRATRRDCDQIFELVNLAFKPEIGKTGIAYRKCDKYRLKDSARKHLEDMWVIKDNRKVRNLLSFHLLTMKFYSPHHTAVPLLDTSIKGAGFGCWQKNRTKNNIRVRDFNWRVQDLATIVHRGLLD